MHIINVLNMISDTCITLIFIFTAMFYLVSLYCFKSLLMSKKLTYCGGKHLCCICLKYTFGMCCHLLCIHHTLY